MSSDHEPLPFVDSDPNVKTDAKEEKCSPDQSADKPESSYPIPLSMLTRDQMAWLLANKINEQEDQFPPVFGMNEHGADGDQVAGMLLNGRKKFGPGDPNEWLARQANRWFHEALKFMKANGELGLGFMEHLDKADQNAKAIYELHLDLESERQRSETLKAKLFGAEKRNADGEDQVKEARQKAEEYRRRWSDLVDSSGEALRKAASGERDDAATLGDLRTELETNKRELRKLQSFNNWQSETIRDYSKNASELSVQLSAVLGRSVRPRSLRQELDDLIGVYRMIRETWPAQLGLAESEFKRERGEQADGIPTAEKVD